MAVALTYVTILSIKDRNEVHPPIHTPFSTIKLRVDR